MKKLVVILILGVLWSLPLNAQVLEVFGGYQYLHLGNVTANGQTIPGSSQGFNGWNAAADAKLGKLFGLGADFSGGYATVTGVSLHTYTYTGGPIVSLSAGPIRPFVQALVGGVRLTGSFSGASSSMNGLAAMAGGGLDVKVRKFVAVRLAQVDWLYFHFGSQTVAGTPIPAFSGHNNVRFSTGIVLRI
jgi:hypothetical protein